MDTRAIKVAKTEHFDTFRQYITPMSQETVIEEVGAMHRAWRDGGATGEMTLKYSDGGVRQIITAQNAHIREGSDADLILERNFSKKGLTRK